MSTIKVDTIATRTGSGNIAISNNVTSLTTSALTTSALTATKIHPSSGTTTNYLSLDSSNELNFKNASNVSQTLFVNYDGGGVHLARGSVSVEADGSGTGNSVFGGNVRFGTAGKGIYLGTTGTTAANLLDDYEEGNWTATAVQGISGFTISSAKYAKVGRFVFVQVFLSSFSGKDGNQVAVGGLPFTVESNAYSSAIFESGSSGDFGLARCQPDANYVQLFKFNNSSHHRENFLGNDLGSHLIFGLGYVTAS
mgnify:CR=1 FL=1